MESHASDSSTVRKDFFVSYNQADRAWAEWIAWQLEETGYTTVLQAWDFRPGGNFVLDMQRAASQVERTVIVLSDDFLASAFTRPEWAAASAQDPTGEKGILVPVRVRACNPQGLLRALTYIDLVTALEAGDEAAARDTLLTGVQRGRRKPAIAPQFPHGMAVPRSVPDRPRFSALPPIWNVPHVRNPNFTGRDELLDQIRGGVTSGQPTALTQALAGLGGVGKTQLATEYAYRYASEYELVWWVRAEEPATLAADYAALAQELARTRQSDEQDPDWKAADQRMVIVAVRRWLRQHGNWLVAFDNATVPTALDNYLPQTATGHVLITSRNPIWYEVASVFKVENLPRDQAIALLLKLTGQADDEMAGQLADLLGHLPLALAQAGGYMQASQRSLSSYVDLFQTRSEALLRRGTASKDYPWTVATTWQLAFQQESRPAADLLNLCAFFAPDNIPRAVLSDGAEHVPEPLGACLVDPLDFDVAVESLQQYSLIGATEDALSVHRLVQAVTRDRLQDNLRKAWAEVAVRLVNAAFPNVEVQTWPTCAQLLSHAFVTVEHARALKIEDEQTSRLLNQVGFYLRERALFTEARTALEQALAMRERVLGSDHPDTAQSLNNLGSLLRDLGDLNGARSNYERALTIREKALGQDHPSTAQSLNNLGFLIQTQGNLARARPYLERALGIRENVLGPDHPDTATSLNTLGFLLHRQAYFADADPYYKRALAIREKVLGPYHPSTAQSLNNLGLLLQNQGDFVGARPYYERALAIRENVLGPNHTDTATSLHNLGSLLHDQRDLAGARLCFDRAVAIFDKLLGPDHPTTATTRRDLEVVLQAQATQTGARVQIDINEQFRH
jgi:tetratricopeptide (TPR) repeat protein